MASLRISASMMTLMLTVCHVARHSATSRGLHGLQIVLIANVSAKQVS